MKNFLHASFSLAVGVVAGAAMHGMQKLATAYGGFEPFAGQILMNDVGTGISAAVASASAIMIARLNP